MEQGPGQALELLQSEMKVLGRMRKGPLAGRPLPKTSGRGAGGAGLGGRAHQSDAVLGTRRGREWGVSSRGDSLYRVGERIEKGCFLIPTYSEPSFRICALPPPTFGF